MIGLRLLENRKRVAGGVLALTASLAAVAVLLVAVLALSLSLPGKAVAATVTVDVGSDWYCDASYDNPDLNSYCTTTINVGDTVT
ncbi:MAG: hypothetical protein GTO63_02430, partial [Anaerolineae bacterium]|nr:hypothetical protein [Anaerolineae bacterium]NIN93917.1 hypothetical protein [Anaerolineae bacterium]NIQ76948.1 hypothetical protein [Anaerolineae bacterium]